MTLDINLNNVKNAATGIRPHQVPFKKVFKVVMHKLWTYEDYVKYLSHENSLVRRWAFDAITNRYPNKYCDEVSKLIGDEDNLLACAAPKYLAKHNAFEYAQHILESFKNGKGSVSSSCAKALAKMEHEPALEDIIDSLSSNIHSESLFGIFDYLGSVHNKNSRETLISAAMQIKNPLLQSCAFFNLLRHSHPEDVTLIINIIFESIKQNRSVEELQIQAIVDFCDAEKYYNDLTESLCSKNIIENPKEILENFFKKNAQIFLKTDQFDLVVKNLEKGHHHDLVTTLMFEIQNIVQHRYPENLSFEDLHELFVKDTMTVALFKELSRQPSLWSRLGKKSNSWMDLLIALVISLYCSFLERGLYIKALLPDARLEQLILTMEKTGSRLPEIICRKIVEFAPIPELKNVLSERLNTWGDIWIVKIMGRIGSREFVPDLLRVLNNSDSLDYIYSDAIKSITALDESADEMIINAIQNHEIADWESFAVLENLPFSESFDLVSQKWDDEKSEMDPYETFARCLKGIADKRGIEKLQNIYARGNTDGFTGEALECLSIIHNVSIPELPDIYKKREEEEKRRKRKSEEFEEIFQDIGNIKNRGNIIPFKREAPKTGRNEPCPCGSGKKYKKCCLNKF
ncbi:MAG: SEC-C metal-binding domain-containing protein [Deltaproteobacteria bacterium]|nr:SEC-C metal-binding domain-containing protein [Deltaproteobacteria bacterium]